MATTNRERATSAFDVLTAGLRPFVVRQMRGQQGLGWRPEAQQKYRPSVGAMPENLDALALLKIMRDNWKPVFADALGPLEQGFVFELLVFRNRWAHQEAFSSADTARLLDTTARMLTAVSASDQAAEILKTGSSWAAPCTLNRPASRRGPAPPPRSTITARRSIGRLRRARRSSPNCVGAAPPPPSATRWLSPPVITWTKLCREPRSPSWPWKSSRTMTPDSSAGVTHIQTASW